MSDRSDRVELGPVPVICSRDLTASSPFLPGSDPLGSLPRVPWRRAPACSLSYDGTNHTSHNRHRPVRAGGVRSECPPLTAGARVEPLSTSNTEGGVANDAGGETVAATSDPSAKPSPLREAIKQASERSQSPERGSTDLPGGNHLGGLPRVPWRRAPACLLSFFSSRVVSSRSRPWGGGGRLCPTLFPCLHRFI